jgi:hypothetical protein
MDRQGYGSHASTRFIVDQSLEPLENKVRKCSKKARSQWEKEDVPDQGGHMATT